MCFSPLLTWYAVVWLRTQDSLDPMDPAAYSDAPRGGWGVGLYNPADGVAAPPGQVRDALHGERCAAAHMADALSVLLVAPQQGRPLPSPGDVLRKAGAPVTAGAPTALGGRAIGVAAPPRVHDGKDGLGEAD